MKISKMNIYVSIQDIIQGSAMFPNDMNYKIKAEYLARFMPMHFF